jgi:hypothetical protein
VLRMLQRSLRGIVAHDGADGFMDGCKALGVAALTTPMMGDELAPQTDTGGHLLIS